MSQHARQQLARFGRLFAGALALQAGLIHGPLTRDIIVSAVIAAGEVAWRQYARVTPDS